MKPNVNYFLCLIITCQYCLISCNKCTTLMRMFKIQKLNMGIWGTCGYALHLLLRFPVNLELLFKKSLLFERKKGPATTKRSNTARILGWRVAGTLQAPLCRAPQVPRWENEDTGESDEVMGKVLHMELGFSWAWEINAQIFQVLRIWWRPYLGLWLPLLLLISGASKTSLCTVAGLMHK